ncbi:MAG: CoA pyrophosphatase [Pseudomonadota bacterium]|nr:CoA pyrophosphatase [Pseudomonadota bacterium]
MDRKIVIERLSSRITPIQQRSPGSRGDHDLNTNMTVPERDLTSAAVLVPIVDHPDGLTVLLTQRTNHLRDHAGQVSFPGGRIEPDDADHEAAALRETHEEIGLAAHQIDLVGRLDRYVTRTGYEVVPVVGFVNPPLDVKPDPFEVADIFEVPLQFLANPDNHQRHSRYYNGTRREFYAMPYNGYYIWGATAGMIVNLSEALS